MTSRTLWTGLRSLGLASLALVLSQFIAPAPATAQSVPPGFVVENAFPGSTLSFPVEVEFLPDGRKMVVQKNGIISMMTAGDAQLPTPFIDLSAETLDSSHRGMTSVAIDPDFAANRWVYILYTVADPLGGGVHGYSSVVRYQESLANPNTADLSTRQVLLGVDWPDGVLACDTSHSNGQLRFAPDKTLLISTGDAAHFSQVDSGGLDPNCFGTGRTDPSEDVGSFRSQSIDMLPGKLLRIDKETGFGLESNPYWDGDPTSVRSRVWLYGLRNEFRYCIRPGTGSTDPADGDPGTLYLGGVGWNTAERLMITTQPGLNLGWPCMEGNSDQPGYQASMTTAAGNTNVLCGAAPTSENPLADSLTTPALWWNHSNGALSNPAGWTGSTAIGGVFYTESEYPAEYQGRYFIADWGSDWINSVEVDASNNVISTAAFMTAAAGPVNIESNPATGDLYYVSLNNNQVRRIRYTGGMQGPAVKVASLRADLGDGFNGQAHPVPGAGSPWADNISTHDATLYNFAGTASSGWQGNGSNGDPYRLVFDGVDDRVTIAGGTISELNPASGASIATWVRTGADVTSHRYILEWSETYASPWAGMTLGYEAGQLHVYMGTAGWGVIDSISPNTWYHIVVSKSFGSVNVYVNGALEFTAATPNLGSQISEVVIGAGTFAGAGNYQRFHQGAIGQLDIFDGALDATEALAEYEADVDLYAAPPVVLTRVVELRADAADGASPYPIPGANGPWTDLAGDDDATLANFTGDASSGWRGTGVLGSPYSLQFDGSDDRAIIGAGAIAGLNPAGSYTASMWFQTGSNVSANQYLMEWSAVYGSPYNGMTTRVESGSFQVYLGTAGWQTVAAVLPDSWYHVSVAKEPGEVRVYLNGNPVFSHANPNIGDQVSELVIGASTFRGAGNYGEHFTGRIAQFSVFDGAMDDPAALAEYQADEALYVAVPTGNAFIVWRSDQADGAAPYPIPGATGPWADLASNYNGTLNNFSGDGTSGWAGDGSALDPYRLNFDGVDDRVTIPGGTVSQLNPATSYTVSLWFRTGTDVLTSQYLMEWAALYGSPYNGMTSRVEGGNYQIYLGTAGWNIVSAVSPNTWVHVSMAKEPGEVRVYVDGELEFTHANPNIGDQISEIVVGASTFRGAGNYGEHFTGDIAQFSVREGAMDDTEALAEYEADEALYGDALPPALARIIELRADQADGAAAYPVPGADSPWVDLANAHDATLNSFSGDAASGWQGTGVQYDPFRLQFDGTDDHLTIPGMSVPELNPATAYSMSMWFRTGSDTSNNQYLMEWSALYGSPYPGMTMRVQGGSYEVYLGSNGWNTVAPVIPNTWYHVAVAKESGAVRVYVNGAPTFSHANANIGDQISELVIGASTFQGPGTYGQYFMGNIAQVSIFEGAMTDGEALSDFQADEALYATPPTPVAQIAQYRADQANGASAYAVPGAAGPWVDLTNNYDATLVNFAGTEASGWQGTGGSGNPYRLQFDGTDDIVTIPAGSIAELNPGTSYTLAMWFRTGTDVTTHRYLIEWAETYSSPWAGMTVGMENGDLRVYMGPAGWGVIDTVEANTWYHIVVSKRSGVLEVYLDGEPAYSSATPNIGSQVSEVVIGAGTFAGASNYQRLFNGSMGQFSLYSGALDASEALALFEADDDVYNSAATGVTLPVATRSGIRSVHPNPFNPRTEITFALDQSISSGSLEIYDTAGRLVRGFDLSGLGAGEHSRTWNGRDNSGRTVSSGVYYVHLSVAGQTDVRKVSLIK